MAEAQFNVLLEKTVQGDKLQRAISDADAAASSADAVGHAAALWKQAQALFALGEVQTAEAIGRDSLRLAPPGLPRARPANTLGSLLLEQGRMVEALSMLNIADEHGAGSDTRVHALGNRSVILSRLGFHSSAWPMRTNGLQRRRASPSSPKPSRLGCWSTGVHSGES